VHLASPFCFVSDEEGRAIQVPDEIEVGHFRLQPGQVQQAQPPQTL